MELLKWGKDNTDVKYNLLSSINSFKPKHLGKLGRQIYKPETKVLESFGKKIFRSFLDILVIFVEILLKHVHFCHFLDILVIFVHFVEMFFSNWHFWSFLVIFCELVWPKNRIFCQKSKNFAKYTNIWSKKIFVKN